MRKTSRILALLLSIVMVLGMIPAVSAVDGAPVPTGDAANAQWDEENRFDLILPDYLKHITDEKPITARQCVKALAQVGLARPQYIPQILSALRSADLSKYKDSMRPLIERDMEETEKILINSGLLNRSDRVSKYIEGD